MDALDAEEARVINAANQAWLPKTVRRSVAAKARRKVGEGVRLLGDYPLWPAVKQRLPEELQAKVQSAIDYSLATSPSPPEKAISILQQAAGVPEKLANDAASAWWGEVWSKFLSNTAPLKPLLPFNHSVYLTDPKADVVPGRARSIFRASSAVQDYFVSGPGRPHLYYSSQVARDGTSPTQYVADYLARQEGGQAHASKWLSFMGGDSKGEAYSRASGELDRVLAEVSRPELRQFRLVNRGTRGEGIGNPLASAAYAYRMIKPLTELMTGPGLVGLKSEAVEGGKLGGVLTEMASAGGIGAADAATATLSAKMSAYARSLFKMTREGLVFDERVLPHLPPDAQQMHADAPRQMMQEIEPFFAKSALSNNQVSREWARRQVEAARSPDSAVAVGTPIGDVALEGLKRYYDQAEQTGASSSFDGARSAVRAAMRDAAQSDPDIKRTVRNRGYLQNSNTPETWSWLSKWLAVPQDSHMTLPSTEQFKIVYKVLTGALPVTAIGWLSQAVDTQDLSDADMAYLLRHSAVEEKAPSRMAGLPAQYASAQYEEPQLTQKPSSVLDRLQENYSGEAQEAA
jgi:hypothetical protein